MTDVRDHLRALVHASPDGSMLSVPKAWLTEVLGSAPTPAVAGADLTVHDLAQRYARKPSTIRMWLEAGQFPTAYKFQGREWRVPLDGLAAFEASARDRDRSVQDEPPASPPVKLSSWRRHLAS